MNDNTLILCASNATREYILDIIESIGRPRGDIMHFRYSKKWVDSDLWQALPLKTNETTAPKENYSALMVFVYQKVDKAKNFTWQHAYPVRFGKIKEWYKTGDGDNDVAYFYFETQNYCSYPPLADVSGEIIQKMKGQKLWSFAALRELHSVSKVDKSSTPDISAFQTTAAQFNLNHFQSPDGKTKYSPVFLKINEIKPENNLEYNKDLKRNSIKLVESNNYIVETNLFLNESPGNNSRVELITSPTYFENSPIHTEIVGSRYDEYIWQLIPSKLSNSIMIPIRISTDIKSRNEEYQVLNLDISISVLLKFNWISRIIDFSGDILPVLATTLLVIIGLLQKFDAYKDSWDRLLILALTFALGGIFIKAGNALRGRLK